ncbi:cupin domain-containing protein [Pseudomonas aeruginosa]|nr:cupin domain-containing protein [Pseudomonas aeruginosa]MCS8829187.1 cupin domain-containing protein [Pseudomonas aeruginosa]MCS8873992.1 cupin domain-containing protein [Pseudomonas aeruginosa]MCS8908010.1 cupin domain-containing protein [Pseudomonas aeruginosa]MCS8914061.1 cupin domain-containing protein [Pseudomonas aeruginosa]
MLVNADFTHSAVVAPHDYEWVASPQPGVERVMLDRLGGEKARATSIVRYAPESHFPQHRHPGGEEIFVLSGTFSEGDQHYPAGWYLRNPPGSAHQPSSHEGAIIFVKLWQMQANEDRRIRIDTRDPACWQVQEGRKVCPLFSSTNENVCLQRLDSREFVFSESVDSAEILVLAGELTSGDVTYERGSWIRLPKGIYPEIGAGNQGATIYLKTDHLAEMTEGA